MRGHLQCRDTLAGNEGCPLKTGTTVTAFLKKLPFLAKGLTRGKGEEGRGREGRGGEGRGGEGRGGEGEGTGGEGRGVPSVILPIFFLNISVARY